MSKIFLYRGYLSVSVLAHTCNHFVSTFKTFFLEHGVTTLRTGVWDTHKPEPNEELFEVGRGFVMGEHPLVVRGENDADRYIYFAQIDNPELLVLLRLQHDYQILTQSGFITEYYEHNLLTGEKKSINHPLHNDVTVYDD